MKRQWVSPPGWPAPPYPGWSPPSAWQPDPVWPAPPPDWQYWQPIPRRPVSSRTKGGAAFAAVGAVLAVIGAFGTWITISTRLGQHITSSGFESGHDGPFVLGLSLVAMGIAAPRLAGVRIPLWLDILAIVGTALLVIICIADTADVHHRVDDVRLLIPQLSGGVGVGLKLALVGSIVALVGSVAALDVSRAPRPPGFPPAGWLPAP